MHDVAASMATCEEIRIKNRKTHELWTTIQDIVGDAKLWPKRIRKNFWTPGLKHFERIITCAFVYVNGLNPEVFYEWVDLLNLASDNEANRHFRELFKSFEAEKYSRSLYAYNITSKKYEYLDGSVRTYVHKSRR